MGRRLATLTTLKVPGAGAEVTFMTFMLLGVVEAEEEAKMDRWLRLTRRPCSAAALEELLLLLLLLLSLPEDGAGDDSWEDGGGGCG